MKHSKNEIGRHAAEPSESNKKSKEYMRVIICCLTAIIVAYLLTGVIFGVAVVHGDSMLPTLKDRDVIIYFRLCAEYERGEIVLIKTDEFRKDYIKRVCGLPGENVSCGTDGSLRVNNKVQNEPYIYEETYSKTGGESVVVLNERQYFVMGDNRTDSRDSRDYGGVYAEKIDGRALLIIRSY